MVQNPDAKELLKRHQWVLLLKPGEFRYMNITEEYAQNGTIGQMSMTFHNCKNIMFASVFWKESVDGPPEEGENYWENVWFYLQFIHNVLGF